MVNATLDLTALEDDGDTLTIDDGRVLRLKITFDPDTTINDFDTYGKVEWTRRNSFGSVRPAGFSGRARIIDTDYPHNLWWEPWEGATDEQMKEELPAILDLVRFGFKGVILELCEGKDYYGKLVVKNATSLWGIDSLDNGYLTEVVRDLAGDLEVSV